jgi:hypothetical protein
MTSSLSSSFSNLDLDNDATSVLNIGSNVDLEAAIQGLIDRCKILHEEVETYIAAVVEAQKRTGLKNLVEYREYTFRITYSLDASYQKISLSEVLSYFLDTSEEGLKSVEASRLVTPRSRTLLTVRIRKSSE